VRPQLSPTENTKNARSILANIVPTDEIEHRIQLLVCLMSAQKGYEPSAADHGRSAIYQMLLGLIEHVSQILPERPDLVHPLHDLLYGLKSLDAGSVAPMLMPAPIKGRRPSPIPQELFRAAAAALMQLKQWQRVERPVAAREVARELNKLGYRDEGNELNGKGVTLWRNKMKKPVDATCPAAGRYRTILAQLKINFPNDHKSAYRFLLGLMPELATPSIPRKSSLK
jgi:hypothetical protein